MSHYNVAVITNRMPDESEIDVMLAPYYEELPLAFEEDDDYDLDPETGRRGCWYNPYAKWDWWKVGGRWGWMLGGLDSVRISDYGFEDDKEVAIRARREWECLVEGREDSAGEFIQVRQGYLRDTYGTKEEYVAYCSRFNTRAVVTPDGRWHEVGKMGWFGCSSESHEDTSDWMTHYRERFIDPYRHDDYAMTIVDCHI